MKITNTGLLLKYLKTGGEVPTLERWVKGVSKLNTKLDYL